MGKVEGREGREEKKGKKRKKGKQGKTGKIWVWVVGLGAFVFRGGFASFFFIFLFFFFIFNLDMGKVEGAPTLSWGLTYN